MGVAPPGRGPAPPAMGDPPPPLPPPSTGPLGGAPPFSARPMPALRAPIPAGGSLGAELLELPARAPDGAGADDRWPPSGGGFGLVLPEGAPPLDGRGETESGGGEADAGPAAARSERSGQGDGCQVQSMERRVSRNASTKAGQQWDERVIRRQSASANYLLITRAFFDAETRDGEGNADKSEGARITREQCVMQRPPPVCLRE